MEEGCKILYRVPRSLEARAQSRFILALAVGSTIPISITFLALAAEGWRFGPGLGFIYLVTAPMWAFGALLAFLAYRLLRRYNGLAVAEDGIFPTFRLPDTPRGRKSFVPVVDMDRVSIEEGLDGFTAAVVPWTGRGVVIASEDLVRYFGPSMRDEFPKLLEALERIRRAANVSLGPRRGQG